MKNSKSCLTYKGQHSSKTQSQCIFPLFFECIDKYIPADKVTFTRPEGGLFIWGPVHNCEDASFIVKKAIEKKVAVVPGSAFNCDTEAPSASFRLNYSTPSDEQIVEGIKRLGEVFAEL